MSFLGSMNVSASGLTAQRLRMDVISQNIANIDTTRTEDGSPYKRKTVLFEERKQNAGFNFPSVFQNTMNKSIMGDGVRVTKIVTDETEGPKVYDPGHPDADEEGYVTKPNVNIVEEMVNMISASRSYEANITAMNTTKGMIAKTMEIYR